jgi:hypothetical protein
MQNSIIRSLMIGCALLAVPLGGCSDEVRFFNASFLNTLQGGVFPVTPGPGADFVLTRGANFTDQVVSFFVTIERRRVVRDENGLPQVDEEGNPVTEDILETVQLTTVPGGTGSDVGYLWPCAPGSGAVIRVGLGENLLPDDPALFVIDPDTYDPEAPLGAQVGSGLPATGLNPLRLDAGNFNCGDTIIFRAFVSTGVAGGVAVDALLQPGSEQPEEFSGIDTFANYQRWLESQISEEELP